MPILLTPLFFIISLALVFDYINGFHDAANSIATVVSTKVLSPLQAVAWAALFNFAAYFIFKDHGVANTVAKTVHELYITNEVIIAGLLGAIIWNLFTWWFGLPSSSSHTLIGGFAGAAITHAGFAAVDIAIIVKTFSFIVIAPLLGLLVAFIISLWFTHSFKKTLLSRFISYGVLVGIILFLWQVLQYDPKKLHTHYEHYALSVIFDSKNFKWILLSIVLVAMSVFTLFLHKLNYSKSQRWFKKFQLLSSTLFSIGHGGNDAQKVMGIIAVALITNKQIANFEAMPTWVPISCYCAIALGTLSGGWSIIKTMGTRITHVTPFEGVAAETAGSITLFLCENLKIPVSTTHTITGAIVGVGATKRISAVRWGVTVKILWSWILTIPIASGLAALIYLIIK